MIEPLQNRKIRVMHVTGPMNFGGAEVMMMELIRHKCVSTKVDFLIHQRSSAIGVEAAFDQEIKSLGCSLHNIVTPVQSGIFKYLAAFKSVMEAEGVPDVIHIHLNARSGIVVLAAKLNGIKKIVVHSHAALTFRGSTLYKIAANIELGISKVLFAAFATDFWGCSQEAIDSLFPKYFTRNTPRRIINNAIDVECYLNVSEVVAQSTREVMAPSYDGLLLGTVGRIVAHKNVAFLVGVIEELNAMGIAAKLAIVGREEDQAYLADMRKRAAVAGVEDQIIFLGARSDIAQVMSAFDVFVSPAIKEGFGLVGAEAQAAGTPCVLPTGFPEMVDMKLGLVTFVEQFSAPVWANAIAKMAGKRCPRNEKISEAFSVAGFSAKENTLQIERAYRDEKTPKGVLV